MTANLPTSGRQIQSTLEADGTLRLTLAEAEVIQPSDDQVVIAVEAAPINPSDLMTMLASADPGQASFGGAANTPAVTARISSEEAETRKGRFGQSLPIGLEGAGTVIAAGSNAKHLMGRKVAALSLAGGTFGQYVTVGAADCAPLPDDVSTREGAGVFCNPLTALAIVETARLEGHSAMIQTAAASNLGQMLVRICQEDGIPLVNIVRRQEQVDLLRGMGAQYVCNSSEPTFHEDLRKAVGETGARIAFDAIGGGTMVSELHLAMEDAAVARMPYYSPYGSSELKQVYVYGYLDKSPMVLPTGKFGMLWDIRQWYMGATLERIGPERTGELQQRILTGLKTTFASHFSREISLSEVLDQDIMNAYSSLRTGEKFLIDPRL